MSPCQDPLLDGGLLNILSRSRIVFHYDSGVSVRFNLKNCEKNIHSILTIKLTVQFVYIPSKGMLICIEEGTFSA